MGDLEHKLAEKLAARDIAYAKGQIVEIDREIATLEKRKRTLEAEIARLEKQAASG